MGAWTLVVPCDVAADVSAGRDEGRPCLDGAPGLRTDGSPQPKRPVLDGAVYSGSAGFGL
jgi:hypothetical protein